MKLKKLILGAFIGGIGVFIIKDVFADQPIDKSTYTLFHPLPKKDWGEMRVDRPNKTQSPYIIDPGSHNLEFDIFTYTRDHDKHKGTNVKTKAYTVFAPTYRVGILHNLEFDALITSHIDVRTHDLIEHTKTRQHGFGDTVLSIKYNFWGNSGNCPTAFGIVPGIKVPTNADDLGNHHVEGTVLLPLDVKISDKMSFGSMVGASHVWGDTHRKYVWSFPISGNLSYDCTEKLTSYIELFAEKSTERGSRWDVTFDFGSTYALTDDWMIDAGMNIGLSKAADDFNPFIGMAVRF